MPARHFTCFLAPPLLTVELMGTTPDATRDVVFNDANCFRSNLSSTEPAQARTRDYRRARHGAAKHAGHGRGAQPSNLRQRCHWHASVCHILFRPVERGARHLVVPTRTFLEKIKDAANLGPGPLREDGR